MDEKEEVSVGVIPGNAQLLSELSEDNEELSKEISYLMGGVECYRNVNTRTSISNVIALEEFSTVLKSIIQRILKMLVNLADDVFDGSAAAAIAVEAVITKAENTLDDSRSKSRNRKIEGFTISTRIQNLSVRYKAISDPQHLLIQLKVFGDVVDIVLGYLTNGVFKNFDSLIRFDPLHDDIDVLAEQLKLSSPTSLNSNPKFTNKGFTINSPQLLGCQKIVITNSRPDGSALDNVLGSMMSLEMAEQDVYELPSSINYQRFGVSLEQSIIKEVIRVGEIISRHNTMNRRAVRRQRSKLVSDRLKSLLTLVENKDVSSEDSTKIRNYIRLLEVYSGWISSPYVGLIALSHRNLNAILNVCKNNAN